MNDNQETVMKIYLLILLGTVLFFLRYYYYDLGRELQKVEPSLLGLVIDWFKDILPIYIAGTILAIACFVLLRDKSKTKKENK